MTQAISPTVSDMAAPPEPLRWQAHPWHQESSLKSASLLGIIFAVAAIAAWSFEQILYGLGSAVVLLAATSRYLLPTDFLVDSDGVAATHLWHTRRLAWPQVARIDAHRDGLFLSPFRQPSRLDGFRGLFLRYGDNKARVAIAIDYWHEAVGDRP